AKQSLAILLLQQGHGYLAAAEAWDLRGARDLDQALVDLGRKVGGRHDDLELPLQPIGCQFCYLHRVTSISIWCGQRDLNPHALRHENLNLACLPIPPCPPDTCRAAPQGPKRGVLARACRPVNFTLLARFRTTIRQPSPPARRLAIDRS